jgi:hypothetical protein
MTVPAPSLQQAQQPFPKLNAPFVDAGGMITTPWQRLLITLWRRTGGGAAVTPNSAIIQQNSSGGLDVFDSTSGAFLGTIQLTNQPGAPAQPQAPSTSPFVFIALENGQLVVFSGRVELSRDGGVTWYLASLTGGSFLMLRNDRARVTWFEAAAPAITFFPGD